MTTSMVERDKKRRKLVAKYEAKRVVLKSLVMDTSVPINIRWQANLKLAKLPRNSSKTRIRNRCIISGRPRGIFSKFGLSRISFRKMSLDGQIPGVRKSSW